MEKHKCKICSRTFTNGRALGGHMKAHLATLKRLPPKKPQSPSFSSYSQSQEEEQKPLIYADLEFSAPDRESETESSKNPTRQLRSKRNRKSSYKHFTALSTTPSPPLSSVSNTSPEEDVAMCLMMLSRDKWKKHNNNNNINIVESTPLKKRVRGKHVCENCRKVFRSSKALTSHNSVCSPQYHHHHEIEEDNNSKIFECEFCLKVFGSGQALGGHKRSHLIIPSSSSTSRMLNFKDGFIDLNLPAPLEDDELSVLSDA